MLWWPFPLHLTGAAMKADVLFLCVRQQKSLVYPGYVKNRELM